VSTLAKFFGSCVAMLLIVLVLAFVACRLLKVPMYFDFDSGVVVFLGCALHAAAWTMKRRRPEK
jgi:hypothetical protein